MTPGSPSLAPALSLATTCFPGVQRPNPPPCGPSGLQSEDRAQPHQHQEEGAREAAPGVCEELALGPGQHPSSHPAAAPQDRFLSPWPPLIPLLPVLRWEEQRCPQGEGSVESSPLRHQEGAPAANTRPETALLFLLPPQPQELCQSRGHSVWPPRSPAWWQRPSSADGTGPVIAKVECPVSPGSRDPPGPDTATCWAHPPVAQGGRKGGGGGRARAGTLQSGS